MKTRVLQNWQPSKLDRNVIKEEFSKILSRRFLVFDVRILSDTDTPHPHAAEWHDDEGMLFSVIWTNKCPTEVMFLRNKTLLSAKDGDIILINNHECHHKMPSNRPAGRWMAWAEVKP